MFTSSRFAPPRTCSSATSTAAPKSPASISRRNRAEPVTFVRSPIRTNPVSSADLERLEPAEARHAAARRDAPGLEPAHRRGDRARCARASSRSSEPATFRNPSCAKSRSSAAVTSARLVVAAEGVRQAGVRMRGDEARRDAGELGDVRPHLARAERAVDADDQRVGVLDRRPERLDRLPASVRPDRSTIVTEIQSGRSGRDLARGDDRGLRVQRVEDRLDQQQVDPAVGERRGSARRTPRAPGRRCASGSPGRRPSG